MKTVLTIAAVVLAPLFAYAAATSDTSSSEATSSSEGTMKEEATK